MGKKERNAFISFFNPIFIQSNKQKKAVFVFVSFHFVSFRFVSFSLVYEKRSSSDSSFQSKLF